MVSEGAEDALAEDDMEITEVGQAAQAVGLDPNSLGLPGYRLGIHDGII